MTWITEKLLVPVSVPPNQRSGVQRLTYKASFALKVLARNIFRPDRLLAQAKLLRTVRPYTLMNYPRLAGMNDIATRVEKEGIKGSFVELGVCDGGSSGVIANAARNNPDRQVWLYDSWEGMPEPTSSDVSYEGELAEEGITVGSEELVRELLFDKLGLRRENIHMVKGWFEDSIPQTAQKVGDIALLHVDCDWYESVKLCMDAFYDRVVPRGIVAIDDYGEWMGCKKAVDEFLEDRNLNVDIVQIDYAAVYFRKP